MPSSWVLMSDSFLYDMCEHKYAWPRGLTYASSRRIGCTIRSGAYVFIAFPAVGEQIACARSTPCAITLDDRFVLSVIVLTRRIDDMDAKKGAPV
jgi:hypothetical protein